MAAYSSLPWLVGDNGRGQGGDPEGSHYNRYSPSWDKRGKVPMQSGRRNLGVGRGRGQAPPLRCGTTGMINVAVTERNRWELHVRLLPCMARADCHPGLALRLK